jgi:hypothetical protein
MDFKGMVYLSFATFSHLTRRKGTHRTGITLFAVVNANQTTVDALSQTLNIPQIGKIIAFVGSPKPSRRPGGVDGIKQKVWVFH